MIRASSLSILLCSALLALPAAARDNSAPAPIEYLLQSISDSGCTFIRNGSEHSSIEAEKHLRMKYNRTRSRIRSAEAFIDHLASQSSWTGKPYSVRCADRDAEPSRDWLYRLLEHYREAA